MGIAKRDVIFGSFEGAGGVGNGLVRNWRWRGERMRSQVLFGSNMPINVDSLIDLGLNYRRTPRTRGSKRDILRGRKADREITEAQPCHPNIIYISTIHRYDIMFMRDMVGLG